MSEADRPLVSLRVRRPWVTQALCLANVLVYLLGVGGGDGLLEWIEGHLSQDRWAVWQGEYWRLITATFVHASVGHLALNMFALVGIGKLLERVLGRGRFVFLYFASGISGAVFFQVFSTAARGVGASGAVYGLFGAFLVFKSAFRPGPVWRRCGHFAAWTAFVLLGDQVFAYFLESVSPVGVASSAHLGGFSAGVLLGISVLRTRVPAPRWAFVRVTAVLVLSVGIAGLFFYGLFFQPHDPALRRMVEERGADRSAKRAAVETAARAWLARSGPLGVDSRHRGYWIYDLLLARDSEDLATEVLTRLLESAERELEDSVRARRPADPDLANEIAWYRAMRGKGLEEALLLVNRAIEAVDHPEWEGAWKWLLPGRAAVERLSMYLNTRGWIEFLLGERENGLRDLRDAARMHRTGGNYLYLALAHERSENYAQAREALRSAVTIGGLSPYEAELAADLAFSLGGLEDLSPR